MSKQMASAGSQEDIDTNTCDFSYWSVLHYKRVSLLRCMRQSDESVGKHEAYLKLDFPNFMKKFVMDN